ncbi:hypothetical protein ACFQZO_04355 [Bradyrhizobium sp. GCM10027634]|uniref:hypothetical protein n=1 Tax=unclassified Bradyrhizobium TaxID=2631580 RepID=UPI00188A5DFC|nr:MULTISPECIES: hypothetical protein [unclassified Bradyrhizobium]MDN5000114.1 hypothetical protein [Bradyrhizobium sp. WYCCWR 12677]QOZ43098.1 hypothetical protein XH89_06165 [Bradyrhizobium sp. CCBAU 53340]
MTSISTDADAGSQAEPSPLRRPNDQVFTLAFLITSAVATFGWLYVLAQVATAVVSWLCS